MADRLGVLPHIVEAVLNHVSGHRAGVAGFDQRCLRALAHWPHAGVEPEHDGARKLSPAEISPAIKLLASIRKRPDQMSDDLGLRFALRRKLIVKLTHDERSTPAQRNKFKRLKRAEQNSMCPICSKQLPLKYAELDRFSASAAHPHRKPRDQFMALKAKAGAPRTGDDVSE